MTWIWSAASVAVIALALLGLLVAERRQAPWRLLAKMVVATGFVLFALERGALDTTYGRWLLAALCFSWLGDLLLGIDRAFLAGMIAFALAHALYIVTFATLPLSATGFILGAASMLATGVFVLRWLRTHLEGPFRMAVPAYIAVIGAMVATAVATGRISIWGPAAVFAISDVFVAANTFVAPRFANKAWGLPLYFAAQYALAATV